jgi:hypothetical protein
LIALVELERGYVVQKRYWVRLRPEPGHNQRNSTEMANDGPFIVGFGVESEFRMRMHLPEDMKATLAKMGK